MGQGGQRASGPLDMTRPIYPYPYSFALRRLWLSHNRRAGITPGR
jgi:hypothetical protein